MCVFFSLETYTVMAEPWTQTLMFGFYYRGVKILSWGLADTIGTPRSCNVDLLEHVHAVCRTKSRGKRFPIVKI